jgi:hypothetical protein
MSQNEHETKMQSLIEAWIEERIRIEEVEPPPDGESRSAELLVLLTAARHARAPQMSDSEAERVFEHVRSRIRFRGARTMMPSWTWLRWAAASIAIAGGLAAWAYRPGRGPTTQAVEGGRLLLKEVLFESVQKGKVVRFEMQVYRTTIQKAKEAPRGQTPSL